MNIAPNPLQATIDELAAFGKNKGNLVKALNDYLLKIQKRADEEKKSINAILSILAGNSETPPQKNKKIKEKRIKLTNEQILVKVQGILAESEELPKSQIASKIGITNPRFEKFYKTYSHLFGQKGKFKKSKIFLVK